MDSIRTISDQEKGFLEKVGAGFTGIIAAVTFLPDMGLTAILIGGRLITGIGTNIGKTVVSAILTEALEADYWKPIQAGDLDNSDSLKVQNLISNSKTIIHPEAYRLNQPMSPHAAAKIDRIEIDLTKINLPKKKPSASLGKALGRRRCSTDESDSLDSYMLLAPLLSISISQVRRYYLFRITESYKFVNIKISVPCLA